MVVIISCWRRVRGSSGDINTPNVEKAWKRASGIRLWDATMPASSSSLRKTGEAYSCGYRERCDSNARSKLSFASESETVLIQVIKVVEFTESNSSVH